MSRDSVSAPPKIDSIIDKDSIRPYSQEQAPNVAWTCQVPTPRKLPPEEHRRIDRQGIIAGTLQRNVSPFTEIKLRVCDRNLFDPITT